MLIFILGCNSNDSNSVASSTPEPMPEIKSLNIAGFTKVHTMKKDGSTFVMFEPFIPRDDTAMTYAFLEIGEQVFHLKKKPWPQQDIVDVPGGRAIRYKYSSKTLHFMPMKNDDGTIHTVMVTEK